MSWECGCGVLNKDSKTACRACRTPQGMVWSPHGFISEKAARFLAKVTHTKAPRREDRLGRSMKLLWMAGIVTGVSVGIHLGRIRSAQGLGAVKAVVNHWKNLLWGYLPTSVSTEAFIGVGVVLALVFFISLRQRRQYIFTVFAHTVLALIMGASVGALTYIGVMFAHEIGPYFRFRW
ncbi:MAG: hypothetical protein ACE5FB_02320 [Candidatus Binatia bacterium]